MRTYEIKIHVTLHDDGAVFHDYEIRGVKSWEFEGILKQLAENIMRGTTYFVKDVPVPRQESA